MRHESRGRASPREKYPIPICEQLKIEKHFQGIQILINVLNFII